MRRRLIEIGPYGNTLYTWRLMKLESCGGTAVIVFEALHASTLPTN